MYVYKCVFVCMCFVVLQLAFILKNDFIVRNIERFYYTFVFFIFLNRILTGSLALKWCKWFPYSLKNFIFASQIFSIQGTWLNVQVHIYIYRM